MPREIILFWFLFSVAVETCAEIRLTSPEEGTIFVSGASITLRAEATGEHAGKVASMEFSGRGVIGEDSSAPFSVEWNNVPIGVHSIVVRATTDEGVVESWKTTIAVRPAPGGRSLHVDARNSGANPDGSLGAPYPTVQGAIDNTESGDTVKVAAGEYQEQVMIRDKNVRLEGGYTGAAASVYAGGGEGDFTTRLGRTSVLRGSGTKQVLEVDFNGTMQWCVVDGLTISGGTRGVRAHTFELSAEKSFFFYNNEVSENTNATDAVAGVVVDNLNAAVFGNTISRNQALSYAGLYVAGNTATCGLIKGNIVEDNESTEEWAHAAGIAFRGRGTSGSVTRNIVRGNRTTYGAGIFIDGDVGANFARLSFNSVMRNEGVFGSGTFIDGGATAVLENELICWNESRDNQGGAVFVDSGPNTKAILVNCTVAHNLGYFDEFQGGNGLFITEDVTDAVTAEVKNSVFWRNSTVAGGKEVNAPAAGTLTIEYSDVEQELVASPRLQFSNVINADPLFADPVNEDFHLKSSSGRRGAQGEWVFDNVDSPALDAGDTESAFGDEPVPNGGRINLGAWGNSAEASRNGFTFSGINRLAGGGFEILGRGKLGNYRLQGANSFGSSGQETSWGDVGLLQNTSGEIRFEDTEGPGPSRFYRAVLVE